MSKHEALVFQVKKENHPNADKLALVTANGYLCGVRKDDFSDGDLAVLVEPDPMVPTSRAEFAFLSGAAYTTGEFTGYARITARRFRGLTSYGLVVKAPEGVQPGDDCFEALGLKHWDPEMAGIKPKAAALDSEGNDGFGHIYDLEHGKKHAARVFTPGETVVVTEKVHGTNCRVLVRDGRLWCGSRTQWKKPGDNHYWKWTERSKGLMDFLAHSNLMILGEVVGPGVSNGSGEAWRYMNAPTFLLFDAVDLNTGSFLDHTELEEVADRCGVQRVPFVATLSFESMEQLDAMAVGPSLGTWDIAPPFREGVVVRPDTERYSPLLGGRAILKFVSGDFLAQEK